jgi:hypothetical protein
MPRAEPNSKSVTLSAVFQTWWPLAASWLLMALELPFLSAAMARLEKPTINLAAYGGIVFPLALIIEAPIIMLLAASTALSKDWTSYRKIRRFMNVTSGVLTLLHAAAAFTPLYFLIAEDLIGAPAEIIEPARIGLMIMLPWTWAIAYRRFNQGVLIRFGHSMIVGKGTLVRLGADLLVLSAGYLYGQLPGIVVATSAVAAGVLSEALYIGIKVQPVLEKDLKSAPSVKPELTRAHFLKFYLPLALTSLMTLLSQPLISSALSRMPRPLDSLAVWPVMSGILFLFRASGVAYNEVVVSLIDQPGSFPKLKSFTGLIAGVSTGLLILFAATPLSGLWFDDFSALQPELIPLAKTALWLGLLVPAANTLQSWYQGIIMSSRKTRGIPEAVAVFLITTVLIYAAGIVQARYTGIYIGVLGFSLGMSAQAAWLWYRSRKPLRSILARKQP